MSDEKDNTGFPWLMRDRAKIPTTGEILKESIGPMLYCAEHPAGSILAQEIAVESAEISARELLANWMRANSYATGHGDTIKDLLKELDWQHRERMVKSSENVRKSLDGQKFAEDRKIALPAFVGTPDGWRHAFHIAPTGDQCLICGELWATKDSRHFDDEGQDLRYYPSQLPKGRSNYE